MAAMWKVTILNSIRVKTGKLSSLFTLHFGKVKGQRKGISTDIVLQCVPFVIMCLLFSFVYIFCLNVLNTVHAMINVVYI